MPKRDVKFGGTLKNFFGTSISDVVWCKMFGLSFGALQNKFPRRFLLTLKPCFKR